MRRLIPIILTMLILVPFLSAKPQVRGRVSCDGRGVAGVVVSDGVNVTATDAKGNYRLPVGKRDSLVFISIPSGYTVERDGLIPRHFVRLDGKGNVRADFELKKVDDSNYSLLVFTDVHLTGDAQDDDLRQFGQTFFPDICRTAESLQGPVYAICLGDMTTDGKWYVNNFGLDQYKDRMSAFPVPVFHIMGNHDNERRFDGKVDDWEWYAETTYRSKIGPNYYSFNIGGVHYLMLDNIVTYGPGCDGKDNYDWLTSEKYGFNYFIDEVQMEWIGKDLSYVDKNTPLVVCMHVPFCKMTGLKNGRPVWKRHLKHDNYDRLLEMVKDYKRVDFLCGHSHRTQVMDIADNMTVHMFPSASSVSWKLNDVFYPNLGNPLVCDDGTPGGYYVYTIDNGRVSWQFKSNYHSFEESQCSVYDLNKFSSAYGGKAGSNAILVNVFDWDPMWKVEIFEDGLPLQVKQIWGYDPLYTQIREETELLQDRPKAFRPTKTLHLFKTVRKSASSSVKIKITDRFGREYQAVPGQLAE